MAGTVHPPAVRIDEEAGRLFAAGPSAPQTMLTLPVARS